MPKILDWYGKEITDPKLQYEYTYGMVGPGWHHLVKQVLEGVPEDTTILQVKSKFGQLRIYLSPEHPLEEQVLHKSMEICPTCGLPADQVVISGWVYTLCPDCERSLRARYPQE